MQYYGTLGPACADIDILVQMLQAGMTGIRLNLSHGDLEENGHWLDLLRQAADRCRMAPEILIDLRGPELRLGKMEREVFLDTGSVIRLSSREDKSCFRVPSVFMEYAAPGDHVLIDDGKLELELLADGMPVDGALQGVNGKPCRNYAPIPGKWSGGHFDGEGLLARVIRGGLVKAEKSLSIVGKEVLLPVLTESDYRNIRRALHYGVTAVMQPFVSKKEDLLEVRRALKEAGAGQIRIFAKIENMQGVRRLEDFLPYADHIVIARGDLGNAMPLWELPRVQKQISELCRTAGKPFMVVTQMLDSMHERAVPTRAEVADIYNAVLDGAASLMLTGETAVGSYPVEAMNYLVKTGQEAEKFMREKGKMS